MTAAVETAVDLVARSVLARVTLRADRTAVWTALTTDALAGWLGRPAGPPLRMGARFRLAHAAGPTSAHRVTRWRPGRQLGWTWSTPGADDSTVAFRLTPLGAVRTVLTVEHRGLGDVVGGAAAWERQLDRLDGWLTGAAQPDPSGSGPAGSDAPSTPTPRPDERRSGGLAEAPDERRDEGSADEPSRGVGA